MSSFDPIVMEEHVKRRRATVILGTLVVVVLLFVASCVNDYRLQVARANEVVPLQWQKCDGKWRALPSDTPLPRSTFYDLKTATEQGERKFRDAQRIDAFICLATEALLNNKALCGMAGLEFGLHRRIAVTRMPPYVMVNMRVDPCLDDMAQATANYTSSMCALEGREEDARKLPHCVAVQYAPIHSLSEVKRLKFLGPDAACISILYELMRGELTGCLAPGRMRCAHDCHLYGRQAPTEELVRRLLVGSGERVEL